jgi:hypothetical protein
MGGSKSKASGHGGAGGPNNNASAALLQEEPKPPKPVSEMSAEEQAEWQKKLDKHKEKLKMAALMEKNLAVKAKHGAKPIEPPQPGSLLGKAKKAVQDKQEHMQAPSHGPPKNETVKERMQRQALASAAGSGTGGATAVLGEEIANSKMNHDLAKKRAEFDKKQAEEKKKEETARKKAEEDKKKAQPKGLKDFLDKNKDEEVKAPTSPTNAQAASKPRGLNAFLSQSEDTPASPASPTAASTPSEEPAKPKGLRQFLSQSSADPEPATSPPPSHAEEAPAAATPAAKPVNKLASFLSATEGDPKSDVVAEPSQQAASPARRASQKQAAVPLEREVEVVAPAQEQQVADKEPGNVQEPAAVAAPDSSQPQVHVAAGQDPPPQEPGESADAAS